MYGLKMKNEYILDLIDGIKNTDARLKSTSIRGKIGLIDTDTNILYAYCNLDNVIETTYEEYILWHVSKYYTYLDAKATIDDLEFTKLREKAYFYSISNVEKLSIPPIVNPINENETWIQFNEDDFTIGYKKLSLFDL